MLIQHKYEDGHGAFYVEEDGDTLAEMIYSQSEGGPIIIEHTEVEEKLRGKNVGYQLVLSAVEYAREHSFKIKVLCSFAKSVFDKKPELQDVLA